MSENQSEALSLPAKLPLSALLGLKEPEGANWARLRALQYAKVAQLTKLRAFSHAVCAGLAVWASFGVLSKVAIFIWLAALVVAMFYFTSQDWLLRHADGRTLSRQAAHRHSTGSVAVALAWCVPMVMHLIYGTSVSLLGVWTVVSLVAVGSGILLATAPLAALLYIVLTCGTGAVTMYLAGLYGPSAVAVCFIPVIGYGVLARAETFLRHSVAKAGMTERNEVVSLLLREFEENEADWLWQIDNSRRIRSASPRFAFALGMQPEDIEGAPFLQLVSGRAWDSGQFPTSLHDLAERLKRRESFSNLLVKVTIGDQQRWWELSGTPMLDEKGQNLGFRGVGSDVTEQRESSEKIAYLARYDTLTGLPNRLMLHEALGEAMRYAKQWRTRCAFLMIDLDRFKAVNDSLGHLVGDRLLAQVSARLKELMTDNETCGRLGGDEFAIVIRDASDPKTTARVAQRIIDRLSQPYEVDNHTLYVGASVGSAIAPRDGKTVEELMRNADLALYRSKDTGGGEHCEYEPALHALAEERRQLEFSLRKALERKELMLNFQPIVDTMNESIVSFEALLRWNSAEHGFVGPDKFIPLAEETRLIVPIGQWVMEQACLEAARWPSHIKINVNVSPEQLMEPDFAPNVVRALQQSGLDANRLEIEVTESIFMRDADVAGAALEQVMALGCQVALDDFGTGFSSLGYLRKLRFTTIKIDRSFVQGAAQGSNESLAIVRAVVAMADSLEMGTTAEGVETAEEAELIRKLGCTKIQGYYFGRPMPDVEARALFDRQNRISA